LAYEALRRGGTAPAILNAANEVAVQAFLDRKIGFMDIPRMIEATLDQVPVHEAAQLECLIATDDEARRTAQAWVEKRTRC
jgi:1-deoxy-D-xylulose-5-phosphate reductoisomerase